MSGKCLTGSAAFLLATVFATATQGQVVKGAEHSTLDATQSRDQGVEIRDHKPDGKGRWHRGSRHARRSRAMPAGTTNGIYYHGGPVMTGPTNVYYIWYGNWSGSKGRAAQSILLNMASSIGGTRYFKINTTYANSLGARVSNVVRYSGSANDDYSQGSSISDAGVQKIVDQAIVNGALPKDANGMYFVLASKDVKETSGFCQNYCGWHSHASVGGADIKFAFVGDPDAQCPSACEEQTGVSPNGDPGADAMASIIAHELSETVTDPDFDAWYDENGQENGDKCAWSFGTTRAAANGSLYNVTFGSRQYLIQQNWVNVSGGYCAMHY